MAQGRNQHAAIGEFHRQAVRIHSNVADFNGFVAHSISLQSAFCSPYSWFLRHHFAVTPNVNGRAVDTGGLPGNLTGAQESASGHGRKIF